MSNLTVVRGTVIEAKIRSVSQLERSAHGHHPQVQSKSSEMQQIWLNIDGKELAITSPATTPFRAGHSAAFVLRDDVVLFALNETTAAFSALPDRFLPREAAMSVAALLMFVAGALALLPLAGGAPIGHVVFLLLIAPFALGFWSWRMRRRVLAQCWSLTGWQPS